nr:capsid protein [Alphachrysovirus sp. 'dothistromae']
MSQINFSNERYDEKTAAFNALRSGATALRRSKALSVKLTSWDPATRAGASNFREKQNMLGRDIGSVANYFDNKRSSALEVICKDEFTVNYQIYGDIRREAVFGQNTLSIFFPIKWSQCEVNVSLYPDVLDKPIPREKFTTAAREGIPNRDDIAKVTGWNRNVVRDIQDTDISMFKVLIGQVMVGQSKLTRLVKGFLMLLECMERDHIDVVLDVQNTVLYNPTQVLNSFRANGRAYVYNSKPSSSVHTAVLWRMCGAYPPPEIRGSHIQIPADGANVFMVLEGAVPAQGQRVRLTQGLIYASIMAYAMDVSCTQHLQQALIIACSLQQNRYFSRVQLPAVVSVMDLMIPAFMTTSSRLDKPILSIEMATSVGRLRQMLMFMNVKDVLTSAELSTSRGFDPAQSMRSYMSSQAALITQMSSEISALCLVEAAIKMKVHEAMREDDFSDILNLSAFEGLWLCQEGTKSVKNGIISALVNGVSDLSGDMCSYDIVRREMDLGRIVYDPAAMPKGAFTVGWVCVSPSIKKAVPAPRKRLSRQVTLVHPCETKPGSTLRVSRKKRFMRNDHSGENETSRSPTPETTIPVKLRFGSPKRSRSSTRDSVPPPYVEEISETSSTVSSEEIYSRTRLANEVMEKVKRKEFVPLSPMTEVTSPTTTPVTPTRSAIDAIVGNTAAQTTDYEKLEGLAKGSNVKLSGKEVGSLLAVLNRTKGAGLIEHARDITTLVDTMAEKQMFLDYDGPAMSGNSNLAKRINQLIDFGAKRDTTGSQLRKMMEDKKAWKGEITTAPIAGLRHVVNTQPWIEFLTAEGIDINEKIDGRIMLQVLAETMSRLEDTFAPGDTKLVHEWITGTSTVRFPMDITKEELTTLGAPSVLSYRVAPSSFGPREFTQEDSKYVVMAARINRCVFDTDVIANLSGKFTLPSWMMAGLRENYGLFQGRKK